MKKILSVMLCVVMLGAMFCASASAANELTKSYDEAKDGELLYEAVFNSTDGVYVPRVIREAAKGEITTSDDGKTITVTHEADNKGGFWYGGEIRVLRSVRTRATLLPVKPK